MVNATILFEIIRDTWQTVSLILSQISNRLSGFLEKIFGFSQWSYIISLCFGCFFDDLKVAATISTLSFIIQSIVALIAVFMFRKAARLDLKYDAEQAYAPIMGGGKRKAIYVSTLVLTTLYLPLARDCTKIFACDASITGETLISGLDITQCYDTAHIIYIIAAVIVFLAYIVWTPFLLYRVIQNKKPQPQFFDETGEYKDFTDEDYEELVENLAKNPYKPLFEGYARKYAHYKVMTMIFKLLLTIPAALLVGQNQLYPSTSNTTEDEYESWMYSDLENNSDTERENNSEADLLRNIIILVVCASFTFVSIRSKPFIDKFENRMDTFTNIIEVSLASIAVLLVLFEDDKAMNNILSLFVDIIDLLLIIVTIYALCRGSKWLRRQIKACTQTVTFTTDRSTDEPLILYHYADKLNFCKERKVKLWCKFWDDLIFDDSELRIPPKEKLKKKAAETASAQEDVDYDQYLSDHYKPKHLEFSYAGYFAPFLMNFESTIGERHAENKAIIQNVSMLSYKLYIDDLVDQMNADRDLIRIFRTMATQLQGKDVWWHGPCALVEKIDKELDNKKNENATQLSSIGLVQSTNTTHFGSLIISPFPFMAKLQFDQLGETAIFSLSPIIASRKNTAYHEMMNMMKTLVNQNADKEVQRRKYMRLRFRAMNGHLCEWRIQKNKNKTISRTVTKQVYNSETQQYETKQETESKTVSVLFTFCKGKFTLYEPFRIALEYCDGVGSHYDSAWGKNYSWSNETYSLAASEIGINDKYAETAILIKFLRTNYDPNRQQFDGNIRNIKHEWQQQRKQQCNMYADREAILSYAFYYYVYNDDTISYPFVQTALRSEINPKVREIAVKYDAHLKILFNKYLAFINSGYHHAFWFLFWNDVWTNNEDVKLVRDNPEIFNCSLFFQQEINNDNGEMTQCLALHMHTKEELVECLDRLGLHGTDACIRRGWFNNDIIDRLYKAMDELKLWNDSFNAEEQREEQKYEQMETQTALHSMSSRKGKLTDAPKCTVNQFKIKYNAAAKLMQTLFRMN